MNVQLVLHGHLGADRLDDRLGVNPLARPLDLLDDDQARLAVARYLERSAAARSERRAQADAVQLTGDIRQAVAERHELQVSDIVLIEPGSVLKTSSGKVRRASCRAAYESGALRVWGKPK